MIKEQLQKQLEKALDKKGVLFTRLRTPNYRYRGVRYPADYVIWGESATWLIECKQRAKLPLAPSDIRQLKFMQEWDACAYSPKAIYIILTWTEEGYCVFLSTQAVVSAKRHKGLRKESALYYAENLSDLLEEMNL